MDQDQILARLDKALARGGSVYERSDVIDALTAGQMQAFWNDGGLVITQIHQFPKARYLHLIFVAGRLADVMALQSQIVAFAQESKCKRVVCAGRLGWQKVLPQYGWKLDSVGFRLELEG
jgi:hypothetical protein